MSVAWDFLVGFLDNNNQSIIEEMTIILFSTMYVMGLGACDV